MINELDLENGNNFFQCDKKKQMLFLWGQDIESGNFKIDERIRCKMIEYSIPFDEVIEIYDDETSNFILDIFKKNFETKKFVFISNEGYTYQPDSCSSEPDIENCQVIGFSSGKNENDAFNNLLKANSYLKNTSFDKIISYQLVADYRNREKVFYISERKQLA